ncbi:MAG: phage tail sheath family protein [Pseudomonadales bacterium]|nr:phage tail sheath family protein [Pseudomonadales bacterium]
MSGDGVQSDAAEFRNNLSSPYQLYGAAYYPHIQTAITYQYNESDIVIETTSPTGNAWSKTFSDEDISLTVTSSDEDGAPSVYITKGSKDAALEISLDAEQLKLSNASGTTGNELVEAWAAWTDENDTQGFDLEVLGDADVGVLYTKSVLLEKTNESTSSVSLKEIASTQTALHNAIKTALAGQRVILPSSPGVVGIYARVDRDRGVWKSPANESLSSVIGPMLKITNEEQENLNVDAMAGKSINAVRQFTGKGTLVWGARTLAGNDNEWRYISVRRLFNMIEESTQKASAFAVFEPNDASTWLKVKAMIESYLYSLWEKGALAGSTQEAAFYVNVGLGKTMTTDDVLNGRMIIEIGVAPVRPAEFIIIRFSHKLQEA